jgi:excisionase family DNA binding protein
MTGRGVEARASSPPAAAESIRALATVTLDARALDELGPATIDRLADLVAARLAERRAAGEEPLLSVRKAAEVAGAHPETVRKAIRRGALQVAGYLGQRPRLRRSDVDEWVASGQPAGPDAPIRIAGARRPARATRGARARVLGDALRALEPAANGSGARS